MKKKAAVLLGLALFALWSLEGSAGTLDRFGASSRGTAMGGAMISISEGWEASYYNPSALALSRNSTSMGVSQVSGELMKNGENQFGSGLMFRYGINHRFLRDRVGVGVLVNFSTAGSGGGLSLDPGALLGGGGGGGFSFYSDQLPIAANAAFGIRLTNWLGVGVNFLADSTISTSNYGLVVDPILEELIGISTGVVPSNIEGMNFSIGQDPDGAVVTAWDVTFRPIPYLSFGYYYIPETWQRIKARIELVGGEGSILPESQFILLEMKTPTSVETIKWGAAGHIPIPWNDGMLTISYQNEQQMWEGNYSQTIQYQWDADEVFGHFFFEDAKPDPPNLDDISIDRYGVEYVGDATPMMFWKLKNLGNPRFSIRGGYYEWESPQQEANFRDELGMLDADAQVYSFGLGFSYERKKGKRAALNPDYPPRVRLDLHVQHTTLDERDFEFQPDEYGAIPLEDFIIEIEGNVTNIGVELTLEK